MPLGRAAIPPLRGVSRPRSRGIAESPPPPHALPQAVVPTRKEEGQMFNRRGTLAVACLATAMLMLDIAVVNSALPRIAGELHSGLTGLQWIVDAYTLALATVVLTAGSLADRLGRRRLFAAGTVIFTGLVC